MTGSAQTCISPDALNDCAPSASIRTEVGPVNAGASVYELKPTAFKTALSADVRRPTSSSPAPRDSVRQSSASPPSGTALPPAFCRRDDYAFLPAGATAGI